MENVRWFYPLIEEFERRCLVSLAEEQAEILPNNSLIDVLCNAVRLMRAHLDFVGDGSIDSAIGRKMTAPTQPELPPDGPKIYEKDTLWYGEWLGGSRVFSNRVAAYNWAYYLSRAYAAGKSSMEQRVKELENIVLGFPEHYQKDCNCEGCTYHRKTLEAKDTKG